MGPCETPSSPRSQSQLSTWSEYHRKLAPGPGLTSSQEAAGTERCFPRMSSPAYPPDHIRASLSFPPCLKTLRFICVAAKQDSLNPSQLVFSTFMSNLTKALQNSKHFHFTSKYPCSQETVLHCQLEGSGHHLTDGSVGKGPRKDCLLSLANRKKNRISNSFCCQVVRSPQEQPSHIPSCDAP